MMISKEDRLKTISEQARADYLAQHRLFSWQHPFAWVYLASRNCWLSQAAEFGIAVWNEKTIFHFYQSSSAQRQTGLIKIKNDPSLLSGIGALGLTKHPHHNNAWLHDQVIIGIDLAFFKNQRLLNNVVTHELGHALGLPDVHFKSIEYGRDDQTYSLQPCDILAVKKIYGKKYPRL